MKILILGSAGMIGQKLVAKLLSLKTINEKKIQEIILFDVITTPKTDETDIKIQIKTGDFSDPIVSKNLVKDKPELIFHLAAIVSGHAEKEFDLGWNVNAKGSWNLFEAIRSVGQNYHPKLVFTSSLAVFGAPFPDRINDEFFTTPLTSYGSQKVVSELLLSDYSRKGMIDGISIRFPTICVRPGKPNLAASGFFSGIIREPLNSQEAILPVSTDTRHYFASPRSAIHFLIHAAELDTKKLDNRITLNMPGLSATVHEQIESLKRISGNEIVKLIKHKADTDIQKIVGSWAKESGPTNQKLPSYAQVIGACYRNSDPSDIAVTAAGGLVGEVVQVWKPRELNTHETEWGFSCMSYEISGALGIKMANPNKEVISFVGDGSYLLFNSDIYSSVITNHKLIIVVCDNGGHAVINRLQLYKGGKEFNCLLESSKNTNLIPVDFALHAKSMGAESEQVNSISDLEEAFKRAKKSKKTYVISIKTDSYKWIEGSAYWESPTLSLPSTKENEKALKEHLEGKKKQRKGV